MTARNLVESRFARGTEKKQDRKISALVLEYYSDSKQRRDRSNGLLQEVWGPVGRPWREPVNLCKR